MALRPPIRSASEIDRMVGVLSSDYRARQLEAALLVAQRRRYIRAESGPTESTVSDSVVLQKDFLGYTATATTPNIEAEVTRDSDGGMNIYTPSILPNMSSAAIAAIGSPVGGMLVYDTTNGTVMYYDDVGGSWVTLANVP